MLILILGELVIPSLNQLMKCSQVEVMYFLKPPFNICLSQSLAERFDRPYAS